MKTNKLFYTFCLFGFSSLIYGQNPVHIDQIHLQPFMGESVTKVPIVILNSSQQNNTVNVMQHGDENKLQASITSASYEATYGQFGDRNYIDVDVSGYQVQQNVRQEGGNNSMEHYTNNPYVSQNVEVFQEGSNQSISIYGENSMTKEMTIHIQGDNRSLIINNFN